MRRKRRSLHGEFKARVALAALRGDQTLNEVAANQELHSNQVSTWKKQMLLDRSHKLGLPEEINVSKGKKKNPKVRSLVDQSQRP